MRTLTLDRETHIYSDELGQTYASVSSLLKKLFPLDAQAVAEKVSQMPHSRRYFGRPVADILAEWDARRDTGTALHSVIEAAMIGKAVAPEFDAFAATFKAGRWKGPLRIETIVYDEELMMAGTADIIESRTSEDVVWDIKTCRTIYDDKRLQYSAQISLYAQMNQALTGRPTRPGGIIWYPDFPRCAVKPLVLRPIEAGEVCAKIRVIRQEEMATA